MDALKDRKIINNTFYDHLDEIWYNSQDNPIAVLRAETQEKLKWALPLLVEKKAQAILDIGCGAGFIANFLAQKKFTVTGLDFSKSSLDIAIKMDFTKSVCYVEGDAYKLPFDDDSFDAVIAFDFLEHVSNPQKIIKEASRVLKPGGQLLFHTFNRNWLAWLIVIKGMQWFVKNTPSDLHILPLFIKPQEMVAYCRRTGMTVIGFTGIRPILDHSFFKLLRTGVVPVEMKFRQTSMKLLSYCGQAVRDDLVF